MRGSIGIEAVAVIGILLAMFIVINLSIISDSAQVNRISEQLGLQASCSRLAGIINSVYTAGDGMKLAIVIDKKVAVYADSIEFLDETSETKGVYCSIYADLDNVGFTLNIGNILVENLNGKVVIKNA